MSSRSAEIIEAAARRLLGDPNKELSTKTQLRFGAKGSMVVDLQKGTFYDHEDKAGGGYLDLVRRLLPDVEPWAWLRSEGLVGDDELVGIFDYTDEQGKVLFQVCRTASKKFYQRRPNGKGGYVKNIQGVRRVLYRLPDLIASRGSGSVFVPEGEKHADAIRDKFGLRATCNAGGAGKWLDDYSEALRGEDVVVLVDNDDAGKKHGQKVASMLYGRAARVRVLLLPNLKHKGDVVDWIAAGGSKEELLRISDDQRDWEPDDEEIGDAAVPPEFSDESLALIMATKHAQELRFVDVWGRWLKWTGSQWKFDEVREVYNLSRVVCRNESVKIENPKLGRMVASARMRGSVVALAAEDPRLAACVEQWDADQWAINTPNGVVDVRTGARRENRLTDYFTKSTSVPLQPGTPEVWLKFLDKVTGGDKELVGYLQRMLGYACTGSTAEHAFFFLYGTGQNGKSTFLSTVSHVLGDYQKTAPIESFTASRTEQHPTELANLRGARIVTATETEEGRNWAESRIKALTGGDKIAARFMRQDFFEFTPEFKLIIAGNHKPGIKSVDIAMRRRMNLVPFTAFIPPSERDLHIGETMLRDEGGKILNWIIEGAMQWMERGLDPPAAVSDATKEYFEDQDHIGTWVKECCEDKKEHFTPIASLFAAWKVWAEKAGAYIGSEVRFSNKMNSEGYERDRRAVKRNGVDTIVRGLIGIKLRGQSEERIEWEEDNTIL